MLRPSTYGPFLKGTVASTDPYTVPKGSVPRSSNLLLTTRGSLTECDGTQIINAFNSAIQSGRGRFLSIFMFAPTGVQPYYLVLAQGLDQPLGKPRNLAAADGGLISSGLAAATYFYEVTAVDGAGGETPVSNEVSQAVALNHKINLTWNVVPNAQGYNVYRSTTTGTEKFLVLVTQPSPITATISYSDTGQITPGTVSPPVSDTTQQVVLFRMPSAAAGASLPVSYNNSNIVAVFPATVTGFGAPPTGAVGVGSASGVAGPSPSGGVAGMCSLLPQMVQFTNRVAMALGNGFAPQLYSDASGTPTNPATSVAVASMSVDANGVVTVTTSTSHGLTSSNVGTNVLFSSMTNILYNGAYVVLTVPSTTTLTIRNIAAIGQGTATGTMTVTTTPITNTFTPAYPKWVASSSYSAGSIVEPTSGTGNFFKAVQAGVTAGSEPTWANAASLGQEIGDGTVIWQNQGPILGSVPAPPGAGHIWVYAGSLWFLNTSPTNTTSGLDGPTSLRMCDANNPISYNPVNQAFLDKDDGTEGMGLATFTISAEGIPPEGSLIAFKNYGGYQIVGVFGASFFSIQRTRSDMGCIAPRSIQFVPGFGISRMAHLGIANFDGVRDTVASEEVRPYLFPLNDPLVSDITVADATWIAGSQASLTANPPLYATFIPIGNSGGALTRGLVYDLVMKTWSPVDLPFSINCITQVRPVASNPITLLGGFQDGLLHRWQAGDTQWLTRTTFSVVESVVTNNSGQSSITVNLANQVVLGDTFVVVVFWTYPASVISLSSITCSLVGSFNSLHNGDISSSNNEHMYWAQTTSGGTASIVINFSGATSIIHVAVINVRGLASGFVGAGTGQDNASPYSFTPPPALPWLVIDGGADPAAALALADNTFTLAVKDSYVGLAYKMISVSGNYSFNTWTTTYTNHSVLVSFSLSNAAGVVAGTDVSWSVRLPDEYKRDDPANMQYCNRLDIRGVGAGSKKITVTPIVNGVSKPAQSYTLPASGDFVVFSSIQRNGLRFAATLSGQGHIEIDRCIWHTQDKPIGAKSVVA